MLSETEVARDIYQVEEARPSRRARVPKELSLEEIIKNKTSSPCSLPDFTAYLVCGEENAEILQFFNWFCSYVNRFCELTPQEILLSPPWKPVSKSGQSGSKNGSVPAVHSHRRGGSDRLEQILEIMDKRNARDALNKVSEEGHKQVLSTSFNFSTPRRLSGTQSSQLQRAQVRNLPMNLANAAEAERSSQQPCRQEIDDIVQQYIQADAPRRLKISEEDLAGCLNAVKYTTHPSALLPAFTACETVLKARSHPTFIRKSQRNANKPRLILIRCLATLLTLLGFALLIIFVTGPFSKFYRVISLTFWWPSLSILFASFKGICLFLYFRNLRQLRPWEQRRDLEAGEQDFDDDGDSFVSEVKTHISSDNDRRREHRTAKRTPSRTSTRTSQRSGSSSSSTTIHASESIVMQTFGGANTWECQASMEGWRTMSTARRIWCDCMRVENRAIRLLQDRTVLFAICLGGAVSSALTAGSLWLPGGH